MFFEKTGREQRLKAMMQKNIIVSSSYSGLRTEECATAALSLAMGRNFQPNSTKLELGIFFA